MAKQKLTEAEIRNVSKLFDGGMTQTELAKMYNVSQCHISHIVTGKRKLRIKPPVILICIHPGCGIQTTGKYLRCPEHHRLNELNMNATRQKRYRQDENKPIDKPKPKKLPTKHPTKNPIILSS